VGIEFSALRRCEPPVFLPYEGYVPFSPSFMARESIANIISRVEADFGPGALDPLVNLIEQFNSNPTIEATHTN
jgi:hypothetical protein